MCYYSEMKLSKITIGFLASFAIAVNAQVREKAKTESIDGKFAKVESMINDAYFDAFQDKIMQLNDNTNLDFIKEAKVVQSYGRTIGLGENNLHHEITKEIYGEKYQPLVELALLQAGEKYCSKPTTYCYWGNRNSISSYEENLAREAKGVVNNVKKKLVISIPTSELRFGDNKRIVYTPICDLFAKDATNTWGFDKRDKEYVSRNYGCTIIEKKVDVAPTESKHDDKKAKRLKKVAKEHEDFVDFYDEDIEYHDDKKAKRLNRAKIHGAGKFIGLW